MRSEDSLARVACAVTNSRTVLSEDDVKRRDEILQLFLKHDMKLVLRAITQAVDETANLEFHEKSVRTSNELKLVADLVWEAMTIAHQFKL